MYALLVLIVSPSELSDYADRVTVRKLLNSDALSISYSREKEPGRVKYPFPFF